MDTDVVETEAPEAIDEQTAKNYRAWKKNTPFLYDYISTYSLLWPSMTVQFFPDLDRPEPDEKDKSQVLCQRLLLGSYTLLQAIDSISILQLPYYENLNSHLNIDKLNYNPDKLEFELNTVRKKKLTVLQKINHKGDVNKLVYMPQNPDIIASGNNFGDLVVYDRTKHSSYKNSINSTEINEPQLKLGTLQDGHDIFAVDWNKQKEGVLVSSNMAGDINLYDIQKQFTSKENTRILPMTSINNQKEGINDIAFTPDHDSIFSCVDEAGFFTMYDIRLIQEPVIRHKIADSAINTLSINPTDLLCTAVGDSAGRILVWDVRGIKQQQPATSEISAHTDSITRIRWHPTIANVVGSSSLDRTVKIFDLGKPDPLTFIHSGHMLGVNDFDWSLHDAWMVASVADDNSLHVWKPSYDVVKGYV